MKETKDMVKETKDMVKDTQDMVKEIKTGIGSPPVSPMQELSTPPLTQAPPPSYQSQTQPLQQAPPYSQAPPQVYQQAPPYTQAPPQVYQQAPPYTQAPPQVYQQAQHQMVQMTPQPMQMAQQPQIVICSGDLGDVSTMTMCRNCGQRVQTRVVYHSGAFAWLICGFCVVFGCKDAHHFCTNCNVNLCVHKRM
ncbi:lipopolysaccharide-induced tumor necrosis factor-alpha factor homolog [Clupea harengus]|uniref:Lipopolysaccharide-induced tumor necrosis factor-alpha factor homolog n=1 Tax=Clupea harengus TaxID=7950 RepID=A0A6P8F3A6_CLUHA|nr:lipopolysaccharide-induced tumor necrosis factor-alpha factor homolog [Clupea harengus]